MQAGEQVLEVRESYLMDQIKLLVQPNNQVCMTQTQSPFTTVGLIPLVARGVCRWATTTRLPLRRRRRGRCRST